MNITEKIRWMNVGIGLGKWRAQVENCQNLTDGKRGQGSKTAEIYCGDEDYAEFLIRALGELGIKADCEIFTVDGEYHVEVKL